MRYFVNEPYTAYKLKKEYKGLCQLYHSANGGDPDTFTQITDEYHNIIKSINNNKRQAESNKRRSEKQKLHQTIKDNEPPAQGMTLKVVSGGIAVIGTREVTYANRVQIKEHGGIWYRDELQWRAYEKENIKMLCDWFGVSYEWMQEQIKEKTYPTLGTVAKMIANGQPLDEIKNIAIGRFHSINIFLKVFHEIYRPALERLSGGNIQHNDIMLLRNFADDMLLAFGFDMPESKESEESEEEKGEEQ